MLPEDYYRGYAMDIGCGQGTDLIFLSNRGFQVVGVDISINALKEARRRILSSAGEISILPDDSTDLQIAESYVIQQRHAVMLLQADARCLPFRSSLFSFVNDRGCFHHVPVHERMRFVREAARVTESGGIFLLRCFGERYFIAGGAGIPLSRDEITKSFSPYFLVGGITDYTAYVDTIPVDMCWCVMNRL